MKNMTPSLSHIQNENLTLAADFSFMVNETIIESVKNKVLEVITQYSIDHRVNFFNCIDQVDEGWSLFQLGECRFKLSLYVDPTNSCLNISLIDYPCGKNFKTKKTSLRLNKIGKIAALKIVISEKLQFRAEYFGEVLRRTINSKYLDAHIDFQAELRKFCLQGACDDFYDVIRKSSIDPKLQSEISLYGVDNGMGRHIPSMERIGSIVPKIAKGLPSKDLDPIRLSMDFFLSPLDGNRYELYTQKAFRGNTSLIAKANNYTGTSYVRIATEAFYNNADVTIQPIFKAGDENWLLSAIYPTEFEEFIHPEIEKHKNEFKMIAEKAQQKNRNNIGKLEKIKELQKPTTSILSSIGEFTAGFIKGTYF